MPSGMRSPGRHVGQIARGGVVTRAGGTSGACISLPFTVVGLANGVRHLLARGAFEQLHFEPLGPVPLGGEAEPRLALTPKKPSPSPAARRCR
ncbi:MAG: hypothetical protein AMXMBFR34_17090 [Myxococcaceae bacterium]